MRINVKKRIAKLEASLHHEPLFKQLLTIKASKEHLEDTPKNIAKTRKAQELLHRVSKMFSNNIEDRMNVLFELSESANIS
jgi:hypothetical protein